MKIVVMGCGRVGEQVSVLMSEEGHDVSVIDCDPNALEKLGPRFKGRTVRGVGFDRDVLIEAGIEDADAFTATSSSDNVNIVAARIARNVFHVPRVIARLFDPRRAEIYRRLGLLTISSTTWGAERIREMLIHTDVDPQFTFGNGDVCLIAVETPPHLVGRMVKSLVIPGEVSVAAITRSDRAFLPTMGAEFRADDIIHLVVLSSAMEQLKVMLGLSEGG
jgi:trk system potassium uptake protein TrkA